jgi:hypothetical protein
MTPPPAAKRAVPRLVQRHRPHRAALQPGLGRIVALYYYASNLYRNRYNVFGTSL